METATQKIVNVTFTLDFTETSGILYTDLQDLLEDNSDKFEDFLKHTIANLYENYEPSEITIINAEIGS